MIPSLTGERIAGSDSWVTHTADQRNESLDIALSIAKFAASQRKETAVSLRNMTFSA